MVDFSQVTNITLGSTPVEQVTDSQGNVLWSASVDPSTVYFYVEDLSGADNTLSIAKSGVSAPTVELFYSTDQQNWSSMGTTDTTPITATVPANGKLYLKATANAWSSSGNYNSINATGNFNAGGNIMSLLYNDNFVSQTTLSADDTFIHLFENSHIVSAENLILPATTLSTGCYDSMFYGCIALTTAPALPATTLGNYCYASMFANCSSLTQAPALPATTLANSCYKNMFRVCTSLTTAPTLPATTLDSYCYSGMFKGCTALTQAPVLPATTLASTCYYQMFDNCTSLNSVTTYAESVTTSTALRYWLRNVSQTGDFYNLGGATYTSGADGIPTGWTIHTSL